MPALSVVEDLEAYVSRGVVEIGVGPSVASVPAVRCASVRAGVDHELLCTNAGVPLCQDQNKA